MSNERKTPGQDQLVAETYKAVARERAPDHLNERVLRLAADAGRTRYARARAWMRPAAWAATIGLSLAIVLQLTQLPQSEPELVGVPSSEQSGASGHAAPDDEIATEMRRETPLPDPLAESSDAKRNGPSAPAAERQDSEAMHQFAPKDMSVLRDAENRARLQAGPDQPPAVPAVEVGGNLAKTDDAVVEEVVLEEDVAMDNVAEFAAARSLAAVVENKEMAADSSCPASSHDNAESWYRCIEDLREQGMVDLADSEFEKFQKIFPEFVDPGSDK